MLKRFYFTKSIRTLTGDLALSCTMAWVVNWYFHFSGIGISDQGRYTIPGMVYGTAYKPFVYRALLPQMVRVLAHFIPEPVGKWALSAPWLGGVINSFELGAQFPIESLLVIVGISACLMCYPLALRSLVKATMPQLDSPWTAVVGLWLLPLFLFKGQIYDLPQLVLFTLGLALLAGNRWKYYLIILVLATLNKETSLFLIVIFALYNWHRLEKKLFWRRMGIQTGLYGFLRAGLMGLFSKNPGTAVEWHLFDHFHSPNETAALFVWMSIPVLLLAAGLVIYHWRQKPLFLRRAVLIFIPMVILYLLFGFPFEFRTMLEVYSPAYLLAAGAVIKSGSHPA